MHNRCVATSMLTDQVYEYTEQEISTLSISNMNKIILLQPQKEVYLFH